MKKPTEAQVTGKWYAAMTKRLQLDQELIRKKFGKKALSEDLVLDTWRGLVHDEDSIGDTWVRFKGVLVGRLDRGNARANGGG